MERKDKILTQEEYAEIQAEIIRIRMEASMSGAVNSEKIKELEAKIT